MDLMELIQKRESCRSYSERKVERTKIEACIEAARLAPSACNSQPWRYLVVTKSEYLPEIAQSLQIDGFNRFAEQCPAFIVVLEQPALLMNGRSGDQQQDQRFAEIDIGLSVMQLCLEAQEQGLGSCILGSFDEKRIRRLLSVPDDIEIKLLISLGYSRSETPRKKIRKSIDQIVTYISE